MSGAASAPDVATGRTGRHPARTVGEGRGSERARPERAATPGRRCCRPGARRAAPPRGGAQAPAAVAASWNLRPSRRLLPWRTGATLADRVWRQARNGLDRARLLPADGQAPPRPGGSRASAPAHCAPVSRANRPTMNAAHASGAARPPAGRASGTAGDRTSGRRTARRVRPGASGPIGPDRAESTTTAPRSLPGSSARRPVRRSRGQGGTWPPLESAGPAGGAPARQGGDAGAHPPGCECGQPTLPAPSGLCVPCELRRLGVRR